MSSPKKILKKGDLLFKEGDKVANIILIQSGSVSLQLQRSKKNIDVFQVGPSQVLGEQALFGGMTHPFSAVALTETHLVEIPVDAFKGVVEQTPQMIKALTKSLVDRIKVANSEVKSYRLEKDSSPCPEDQVAKVFGSVYHTAKHKGTVSEADPNKVVIEWQMMKQYAQRIFGESIKRLEQAINILVKLKLAEYEMGKPPEDPEAPEQIMKVHFSDLPSVEAFFEFYQYYYFKGGKSEVLKIDDSIVLLLKHFLQVSEGIEPDRFGVITLDFQKVLEHFKNEAGINLGTDHFTRMGQKGLFAKRKANADGSVVLQFDYKEFMTTSKIWRILREIDKWNDKGFVDLHEVEEKAKKPSDGPCCPQCESQIQEAAKFCSECGYKLAA